MASSLAAGAGGPFPKDVRPYRCVDALLGAGSTRVMSGLELRRWSEEDLSVLRAINTPAMKRYLGGPETEEQLLRRHRRYVEETASETLMMFLVRWAGEGIGSVGCWPVEHDGEPVYEVGWNVVPEYQGRGFGTEAVRLVLAEAARHSGRRAVHAYPSAENAAATRTKGDGRGWCSSTARPTAVPGLPRPDPSPARSTSTGAGRSSGWRMTLSRMSDRISSVSGSAPA